MLYERFPVSQQIDIPDIRRNLLFFLTNSGCSIVLSKALKILYRLSCRYKKRLVRRNFVSTSFFKKVIMLALELASSNTVVIKM